MPQYLDFTDDRVREGLDITHGILRGSMENSGQEKDAMDAVRIGPFDTPEQLLQALKSDSAIIAAVRNAALEKAAKVCDELDDFSPSCEAVTAKKLGKAIRALKT